MTQYAALTLEQGEDEDEELLYDVDWAALARRFLEAAECEYLRTTDQAD